MLESDDRWGALIVIQLVAVKKLIPQVEVVERKWFKKPFNIDFYTVSDTKSEALRMSKKLLWKRTTIQYWYSGRTKSTKNLLYKQFF